jgi:hypothetical protein
MPSLQKHPLVVGDQLFHITQFLGAKAQVGSEGYRLKPKFAGLIIPINMHMRWFVGFVTVKI